MSDQPTLDDYRWLTSDAAARYLRRATESDTELTSLAKALRRELPAERSRLVMQQAELRARAADKFTLAGQMFFTRTGLEQATDEQIARYKASRFPRGAALADLCCGIGGDFLALAKSGPAIAVDRDAVALLFAEANSRVCGAGPQRCAARDVTGFDLSGLTAWHIDPDRRASGRRATRLELFEPDLATIEKLRGQCAHAAVKLAPASAAPERWTENAELEWIGSRGECRQQVAWLGKLARHPGRRSAAIVDAAGAAPRTMVGNADESIEPAPRIGRYLYEPHAAIRAAQLTGAIAAQHALQSASPAGGYLTADHLVDDAALAAFEVDEVLPFDVKRLTALLRERGIGALEIKTRGVDVDPAQLARRLRNNGDHSAVVLLIRREDSVQAIVARRAAGA